MKSILQYHEAFSNMADIDLYSDDGDENTDDGYGLDDGLDCEEAFGADDNLTPLQKLEKYMESDNVYTRQMVARGLLDTLRAVGEAEDQTTAVLTAMFKLSEDSDPIVRSELMEQIPHIAVYCHDNADIFVNAIPVYILPMVVRYLDDANNQVRKTSQAALLVLLEQELVNKEQIEEQVVHVILELSSPDSLDEYRTEAVALMSKMAPLLGKEMTDRVFLSRFCEMCTDPLFHVRKVCAANFGDFCSVVSQKSAEQKLLPKFYLLCEDGVWGVRKACAECFMAVSCTCSPEVRKSELSGLFVNLLCDQSRWVRMAAFQQLGPFISTFADADLTGMYVNEDGTIVFRPEEIRHRRKFKDKESESVVSELGESEAKSLPDVIPANDCESSSSTDAHCDITANLVSADIETQSEQTLQKDTEENKVEGTKMEEEDDGESSNEMFVQTDQDISVEEKRAEVYAELNKSHTIKQESREESKDTEGEEKENDENTNESCSEVSNDTSLLTVDSDQNNSTVSFDINIPDDNENKEIDNKNEEIKIPCDSDIVDTDDTVISTLESESVDTKTEPVHIHLNSSSDSDFNSFQFWRTPIPQVEVDLTELISSDKTISSISVVEASSSKAVDQTFGSDLTQSLSESLSDLTVCDNQISSVMIGSETSLGAGFTHDTSRGETSLAVIDGVVQDLSGAGPISYMDSDFSSMSPTGLRDALMLDDATLAQQQNIVPQSLLENYLSMTDPSRAQTVDTEITKYCAYNLPAVAYTLGRENWHCIKNLYDTLAQDMQWKVRRTLAFSIHELATILGEVITHRDLVPVFDGFLKDLDEVRIGILRHLADFLKLLHVDVRTQYLLKVQDFMNVDNSRNWRFRLELAEQLVLISELYTADQICKYLLPMGFALAEDKVSEVRNEAYHLMSVMLKRIVDSGDERPTQYLISQLKSRFAHDRKWGRRQIFTQLCQAIVREQSLDAEQFAKELLPSLLAMADDSVPNVRITLAKCLTCYVMNEDFSHFPGQPHAEQLEETMKKLLADSDRDVRYFCTPEAYRESTNIQQDDDSSLSDMPGI